jgi:16S rRNA A1518/A1519 N6-dimethyltransferase RsmA/KsgA/DIM1 with predicted DNA glycosylase/AP lyase activity
VRVAFRVAPEAFEPEPAVESAVIVAEPFDADDRLGADEEEQLWRVVQAGVPLSAARCSTTCSTRQLPVDAPRVDAALAAAGIARTAAPDARGGGVARAQRGARSAAGRGRLRSRPS